MAHGCSCGCSQDDPTIARPDARHLTTAHTASPRVPRATGLALPHDASETSLTRAPPQRGRFRGHARRGWVCTAGRQAALPGVPGSPLGLSSAGQQAPGLRAPGGARTPGGRERTEGRARHKELFI